MLTALSPTLIGLRYPPSPEVIPDDQHPGQRKKDRDKG